MSRRRRRQEESLMPATSAGLLRFYGEKTGSLLKLRPQVVAILAVGLILVTVLANLFLKPSL